MTTETEVLESTNTKIQREKLLTVNLNFNLMFK
jgi:hypothetical protein